MGNNQSAIDPVHLRIYTNLIQIRDPGKRIQMINTCMASMEYVTSAKRAGIYSYLLNYIAAVNSGNNPPLLPGEQQSFTQTSQKLFDRMFSEASYINKIGVDNVVVKPFINNDDKKFTKLGIRKNIIRN